MFSAAIFILLFLGVREYVLYRRSVAAGTPGCDSLLRSCICSLIAAAVMLAAGAGFLVAYSDRAVYGCQSMAVLGLEWHGVWGVLLLFFLFWALEWWAMDGWVLRGVLVALVLLQFGVFAVGIWKGERSYVGSEPERYRNNLLRCAELVEHGKRGLLAEKLSDLSLTGANLREINAGLERVLRETEAAQ